MTAIVTGKQLKPGNSSFALSIWAGKCRHYVEVAVLPPADHTLGLAAWIARNPSCKAAAITIKSKMPVWNVSSVSYIH